MLVRDDRLLETVRARFRPREYTTDRPESEFPEMIVTVPDEWPSIKLAPLFDVHLGHGQHDAEKFARHVEWIAETPNVLTWNGGDMFENASKLSVGAGVDEEDFSPTHQLVQSLEMLAGIRHKMLFSLPGNHEARSMLMGVDVARFLAMMLEVPFFGDYCFCTIKWRRNNFRVLAHHGAGGAQTAGAQRMAARKDIAWAKPFDMMWTGHLHSALVDPLFQTDFDQRTGRMIERNGFVIISPSYLRYFGTYAAQNRMTPGHRGLTVVELQEDGRMDSVLHASGK